MAKCMSGLHNSGIPMPWRQGLRKPLSNDKTSHLYGGLFILHVPAAAGEMKR
jgi:hypothetical protein